MSKSMVLDGYSGSKLMVRRWSPEVEARACLHILHGLGEHSLRYDAFARFMTRQGFVVWCHDHRQHGESVHHDSVGIYDHKDTWEAMVEDVSVVQRKFIEASPNLPMFMLGHSMGSLVLRSYLQMHPTNLSGAILMGSPMASVALAKIAIMIAKLIESIKPAKPSPFLDKLALGSFIKSIKHPRTPFDWITQDEMIVNKYISDPLCGYVYSPLFYGELAFGAINANDPMMVKAFPKIPTLFISGDHDPCGENGKAPTTLSETYDKAGIHNDLMVMKDMRHEVLNEVERRVTFEQLSKWLDENI